MTKLRTAPRRDWTILVYQGNGCNGKHGEHHLDLLEMQKLPANDRVTILTQGHRDYHDDILDRREIKPMESNYELVPPVQTVVGRQNQPTQLANFLRWGMKEYPSKRTCLVISGYAGGSNGMMVDKKDGLLALTEIRKGLEAGLDGNRLDVLAFDGHWMSCMEAAAEFQDTAELMVASQGRMSSWEYQNSFGKVMRRSDIGARTLSTQLSSADPEESGMTVLDLSRVPDVLYSTEVLLQAAQNFGLEKQVLEGAEWVSHFKDLHTVVEQFNQPDVPGAIRELAQEAQNNLEQMTLEHRPLAHGELTRGVSVATHYDDPEDGQAFRQATSWDAFLKTQAPPSV